MTTQFRAELRNHSLRMSGLFWVELYLRSCSIERKLNSWFMVSINGDIWVGQWWPSWWWHDWSPRPLWGTLREIFPVLVMETNNKQMSFLLYTDLKLPVYCLVWYEIVWRLQALGVTCTQLLFMAWDDEDRITGNRAADLSSRSGTHLL